MTEQDTFGTFLKMLRESKGLTLRQAAEVAQVSSGYLSQIEGGKRGKRRTGEHFAPHPQILKKLAKAYHVPSHDLLKRAGLFLEDEYDPSFSEEREMDRCFEFVIHDPFFKHILTFDDKRAIIDRVQALTGKKLISWAGGSAVAAARPAVAELRLQNGTLYADPVHTPLTVEEVARELNITVEGVEKLVRDGHLDWATGRRGPHVIDRLELQNFKWQVLEDRLREIGVLPQLTIPAGHKVADDVQANKAKQLEMTEGKKQKTRQRKQGRAQDT